MWRHARSSAAPVGGGRAWPGCPRRKFAHRTQKHGDVETNNAIAHPQQGTTETSITSAPENCTTNAHFPPAKATAVSIPHRHKRAKATTVSDKQATSPTGPGCGARGRWRGLAGLRADRPSHTSAHQAPPVWRVPEGPAAVPVGGGEAWPGFETTRRAKLAARTARGRAAAHRHTQRPGPPAPETPAAPHSNTSTTQRNEAATGFPATASSRSRGGAQHGATSDQAVMST